MSSVEAISILEPFGAGNPTPIFGLYDSVLTGIQALSGGKHLKLSFRRETTDFSVLYFNQTAEDFPYVKGDKLNLAVTLDTNVYNNEKNVSIILKDLSFTDVEYEQLMISNALFEELMTGKPVTDRIRNELTVTRDDFVVVYQYLRRNSGFRFSADLLYKRISNNSISLGKLMITLKAMEELGLITMKITGDHLNIGMIKNPPKVEILSAPVLKDLV